MIGKRLTLFAAVGLLGACRFAGPEELVGKVDTHADAGGGGGGGGGATGAPEELPSATRLHTSTCSTPPPGDASVMVDVPEGEFGMGCNSEVDTECKDDEKPAHAVSIKAFKLEATEVTQGQYYACVMAGACLAPTCDWDPCGARATHPVVCVNRVDAIAYCKYAGKRLPTEAEWEKAARGPKESKFPWGDDPADCSHANLAGCVGGTEPVGSHPIGASMYGALDMAGNVVEWVSDVYDPNYYSVAPLADPTGPAPTPKLESFVGRGGGWNSTAVWHRASARDDYEGTYFKKTFGLRCAVSAP